MCQYIARIGGFFELFQSVLVLQNFADIAQQVEVVVADTGDAEHQIGFGVLVDQIAGSSVAAGSNDHALCVDSDGAAVGAPGLAASTAAAQLICYNQNRAIPERGRQPRADGGADEI